MAKTSYQICLQESASLSKDSKQTPENRAFEEDDPETIGYEHGDRKWNTCSSEAGRIKNKDFSLLRKELKWTDTIKRTIKLGFEIGFSVLVINFLLQNLIETNLIINLADHTLKLGAVHISFALSLTFIIFIRIASNKYYSRIYNTRYFIRDDKNKSDQEIYPVKYPSGQIKFSVGTRGLLVRGENCHNIVLWDRVKDIRLDREGSDEPLSEIILKKVEELSEKPTEGVEDNLSKPIDPHMFRMRHEDIKKLLLKEGGNDFAKKVKIIRVVLKNYAREREGEPVTNMLTLLRSWRQLCLRIITQELKEKDMGKNTQEEIIIPTRFFHQGEYWLSFYIDLIRHKYINDRGYSFVRKTLTLKD